MSASAPWTPTSCLQGAKHSYVEECHQQQDADVADGQQVHNLSLRAHFRLVAGGTTAGGIRYCRCQYAPEAKTPSGASGELGQWLR